MTLEIGRGKYPKYPPFAFTQEGVAMLSSILHSDIAIAANIAIMRAFVQVREYLAVGQLAEKLEERKNEPRRRIGFEQASGNNKQ